MPRWFMPSLLILGGLALIPLGLIAKARVSTSTSTRIHIIQDMDNQPRYKAQQENPVFADGRAMRPLIPNTVARGELREDDHFYRGLDAAGEWAATFPSQVEVSEALFARGQERYGIYCAPCHGHSGYGNGAVARRAEQLKLMGRQGMEWVAPTNYHDDALRQKAPGYLFHVITNGVRNMSGYASQIGVADRWAIVAYLKALQRSQHPEGEDDASGRVASASTAGASGGSK